MPLQDAPSKQLPKLSPKEAQLSQAKREERLARYQHVVALRKQGFSQTAIASQVGIGHATVSRWLRSETFPEQQARPRKMALDPYLPFLRERWEAGCCTRSPCGRLRNHRTKSYPFLPTLLTISP